MKKCIIGLLIFLGFLFLGCKDDADTPELSFYNENVLLPKIAFKTDKVTDTFIEYWPLNNPQKIQRSKVSRGDNHNLILVNLKPSTDYQYCINYIKDERRSDVFYFKTGELPEDITIPSKALIDTSQFTGFVLVRRLAPKGADVIIDNSGNVVWYHQYDTTVRRPFVWTKQGTILSSYDSSEVVETDIYGGQVMKMKLEDYGIPNSLHHEVLYNNRGEIVALTLDSVKMDLRKLGGTKDQSIRADGIIVFNRLGEKLWEWNLLNWFDPIKNLKGKINLNQSLGHANSLTIDKDGHYLVSFRDFSQIWKINSVDGTVIWKLGKDGDFEMSEASHFLAQHSIYFNPMGELMVFDNGDRKNRPYSRVLSFMLDDVNMQAETRINIVLPLELSADKMCSAEVIGKGKYLICTSKKNGIVTVINDQAEVLWRVNLNSPSYRAYYLPNPFK